MKHVFSLILTLGLLFAATIASAEEFSLHNGITFGDTMDEVLAKETFAIKSVNDGSEKDSDENQNSDEGGENNKNDSLFSIIALPYSIITEDDTLAGIPGSSITYRFNKDKVLREAIYHFAAFSINSSEYKEINSGLVKKYGTPLGYSNGDNYIVTGSSLPMAVIMTSLTKLADGYADISNYDEWDVDAGDYHVKVDQVEYYYGFSYNKLNYSHTVGYMYFTDEDLENMKKEKENERTEKQNAIDNDL